VRNWRERVLLVCLVTLVAGCSGNLQLSSSGSRHTVYGTVYDLHTEQPIPNVQITIGAQSTTSDSDGAWQFAAVPRGVHTVTASKPSYAEYSASVVIDAGPHALSIGMQSTAETPPADDPLTWEEKADLDIATGLTYLGTPYRLGGKWNVDQTFDCSNFVAHVFNEALGMKFTTGSRGQARLGKEIPRAELRKGDLLFFWTARRGPDEVGHVAIYMGNDRLLHTYREGIGVTMTGFSGTWWEKHYLFARRIL